MLSKADLVIIVMNFLLWFSMGYTFVISDGEALRITKSSCGKGAALSAISRYTKLVIAHFQGINCLQSYLRRYPIAILIEYHLRRCQPFQHIDPLVWRNCSLSCCVDLLQPPIAQLLPQRPLRQLPAIQYLDYESTPPFAQIGEFTHWIMS